MVIRDSPSTLRPAWSSLWKQKMSSSLRAFRQRSKYVKLLLEQRIPYERLHFMINFVSCKSSQSDIPRDFRRASLCACTSCRSFSLAASCCSSSVRNATRVGDLVGDWLCFAGLPGLLDAVVWEFISPFVGDLPGDFFGDPCTDFCPAFLRGEAVSLFTVAAPFEGVTGIVCLRIDLICGKEGCDIIQRLVKAEPGHLQELTLLLFPVPSFKASMPPGPRLLLRVFLPVCLVAAAIVAKEELSTVAFSLSTEVSIEGRCPIDLRAWRMRGALGLLFSAMLPPESK